MTIETGMIVIWYGSSGTVPAGYLLCDGSNGTPDLRDRLPFCGDFVEPAGSVAGSWAPQHNGSDFWHHHELEAGLGLIAGDGFSAVTENKHVTVTLSQPSDVLIGKGMHYIQKA